MLENLLSILVLNKVSNVMCRTKLLVFGESTVPQSGEGMVHLSY